MQQTRFNTIVRSAGDRLGELFANPWRRIALLTIGLLFGIFMGTAIVTTAGQAAEWDIVGAALLLFFTEIVSRLAYGRPLRNKKNNSLFVDVLNIFKIGLTFSLFMEAFKLGS